MFYLIIYEERSRTWSHIPFSTQRAAQDAMANLLSTLGKVSREQVEMWVLPRGD